VQVNVSKTPILGRCEQMISCIILKNFRFEKCYGLNCSVLRNFIKSD